MSEGTPIIQQKIRDLEIYVPLPVDDPEYIDPSTVYGVVDCVSWTLPKKTIITNIGAGSILTHEESGRLSDLDSVNVGIAFSSPFDTMPIVVEFRVYRMGLVDSNKYRMVDVLYYSVLNWLTTSRFDIVIDSSENLTGIIVEYLFKQPLN